MIDNKNNNWNSPRRKIEAKVALLSGATVADTYEASGALSGFTLNRDCQQGKYFGFGVSQKLTVNVLDRERAKTVTTENSLILYLASGGDWLDNSPTFKVAEVVRDENTNALTITAHDALFDSTNRTFAELGLEAPYTIDDVATAITRLLGLNTHIYNNVTFSEAWYTKEYANGANFEGTETIREVLDAIAEVTQTIYFIDYNDKLVFKRLDFFGEPIGEVTKNEYIELINNDVHTLTRLVSATELGDNYETGNTTGATQYVRDNPFWELEDNITELVEDAMANVGGASINAYSCTWRGNYSFEIGDKIAITTKDDKQLYTYILSDNIEYNGGLSEVSTWDYEAENETAANPTNLGEALKHTFAKVDKVNQEIEMVVADTTQLKLDNSSISASVSNLTATVSTKVSTNDVNIAIQNVLADGVNKVITTTGFSFDDNGLKVTKSDSEINTTISEDGMSIYKKNKEVLRADNEGVKATDLHATTYMIIGNNSRFEDFKGNRTACIWIG
jgi:hypothetical protein